MTSKKQKQTIRQTARSRDERLKSALKLNLVKRKNQARRKSKEQIQNKVSEEAVDVSKD